MNGIDNSRRAVSHPVPARPNMVSSDSLSFNENSETQLIPSLRPLRTAYDHDYGSRRTGSSSSLPPLPLAIVVVPRASELEPDLEEGWDDTGNNNDDDDNGADAIDSVVIIQ